MQNCTKYYTERQTLWSHRRSQKQNTKYKSRVIKAYYTVAIPISGNTKNFRKSTGYTYSRNECRPNGRRCKIKRFGKMSGTFLRKHRRRNSLPERYHQEDYRNNTSQREGNLRHLGAKSTIACCSLCHSRGFGPHGKETGNLEF